MEKKIFRSSLTFAAVLALGTFAFAQHGRPSGAGGGMGAGMGAGNGAGMGGSSMGRPTDAGPGMGRMGGGSGMSNMGSQSPSSVLSNSHVNTALTNALGKSGISVPGGNLQSACGGFKNLGECVAAMHVAKNLNLNFSDMQNLMTGSNGESLGKAIQGLGGPNVKYKSEAKKANKQAQQDLNAAASAYVPSAS
ncbi:MAG: hypothetical protein KGM96_13065 [Acidobacteriota bacterium]|nr:hypothetical protein [Acidobacteriota bacterium]